MQVYIIRMSDYLHISEVPLRVSVPKIGERASLIKFFSDQVEKSPKIVGIRLSHYSMDQLYALKSSYSDRLNRNGRVAARKYFFWQSKTALAIPKEP